MGKTVSVGGIGITGADAGNYTPGSTTATAAADIKAMALTVTAASFAKTYDGITAAGATPTITAGASRALTRRHSMKPSPRVTWVPG